MSDERLSIARRVRELALAHPDEAVFRFVATDGTEGAFTWPEIEIGEPESYVTLDEAIENLFGYDWLLFLNANAVEFFLRRFHQLGREVSDIAPESAHARSGSLASSAATPMRFASLQQRSLTGRRTPWTSTRRHPSSPATRY